MSFLFFKTENVAVLSASRGGKPSHTHTLVQILNPSTSAKSFRAKLQNLFVVLVNMDIIQMTLNIVYSLLTNKCNFGCNILSTFCTCRMFADVCSVCTIGITIKLSLNFQ